MISKTQASEGAVPTPTLWGLDIAQLHDRFWAGRGVQVVRQGEPAEIVDGAELFLLCDARVLTIFRFGRVLDVLNWEQPDVLIVRLHDRREHGYRERVVTNDDGGFVRFERVYDGMDARIARFAITNDRQIARAWQSAPDPRTGWRRLRTQIPRQYRATASVPGAVYDRWQEEEVVSFVRDLTQVWKNPDTTVARARRLAPGVWRDADADVEVTDSSVGPVWIGAGRSIDGPEDVVGPAVLWDDPDQRPQADVVVWDQIEPSQGPAPNQPVRQRSSLERGVKRAFDIAFSAAALAVTLPLYPFIMLGIWLEDGRPFFYAQTRESLGGREFPCIKFRSMRKDADEIKRQLEQTNRADGPQFFINDDPRQTRMGRLLRKTNLDELPQFINVLLGQMSVVGPRPSPRRENQYCPAWRETRLSVRPGITGLWQIERSRREGLDFQEWIMYDIEYVENASLLTDIVIICKTCWLLIKGTDGQ